MGSGPKYSLMLTIVYFEAVAGVAAGTGYCQSGEEGVPVDFQHLGLVRSYHVRKVG